MIVQGAQGEKEKEEVKALMESLKLCSKEDIEKVSLRSIANNPWYFVTFKEREQRNRCLWLKNQLKGTSSLQHTDMAATKQEMKTIGCWNIHLLNSDKRKNFVTFISKQTNIELCGIVESWLNDSDILLAKQLEDTDFIWIGNDRKGTRGGGVGFMVKDNLNPKKQFESKDGSELWISIGLKHRWYIAIVYISPNDMDYRTRIYRICNRTR